MQQEHPFESLFPFCATLPQRSDPCIFSHPANSINLQRVLTHNGPSEMHRNVIYAEWRYLWNLLTFTSMGHTLTPLFLQCLKLLTIVLQRDIGFSHIDPGFLRTLFLGFDLYSTIMLHLERFLNFLFRFRFVGCVNVIMSVTRNNVCIIIIVCILKSSVTISV